MENDNRSNNQDGAPVPANDPSKAMDSKKEVEQSPDAKTDQDFPGYPHYPAREDIMDQRNDIHREDIDVEKIPNSRNITGVSQRFSNDSQAPQPDENGAGFDDRPEEIGTPQNVENDDLGIKKGTEADVSEEERMVLDDASYSRGGGDENNLRQASMDTTDFEGEPLNEESFGAVRSGAGLDMPDETAETNTDAQVQSDEENKYYSLGSDRQDQNEEDPYSGPARGNDA